MTELNMNRGFEAMIPKQKTNPQEKKLFLHHLKFSIFGREYTIMLEVNRS